MEQGEFTGIFCARPQNFAWFLGAGASRSAGLPTATDVIWELKRGFYCRRENQDVTRQDIQSEPVRDRIQSYCDSQGLPPAGAPEEYSGYFEKIFGDDREKQRRFFSQVLAEDNVTLSVGHRALGALLSMGQARAVFTTNFDSVIERAVAEVAQRSLSAYHIEGAHNAVQAFNNEEYPFYCKLHGDFRYDTLKNLPADLAAQNEALSRTLVTAGNRFGFVVAGYSGRDASVMSLFHSVLESQNPFPHGLYWTTIKGASVLPAVAALLGAAKARGVTAELVQVETFDAFMLRLWRNLPAKPQDLDAKVRRSQSENMPIPLPAKGTGTGLVRLNALPVDLPRRCWQVSLRAPQDWADLRASARRSRPYLIVTRAQAIWCWGQQPNIRSAFGADFVDVQPADLPDFTQPGNLHFKGFLEEAIGSALTRGRPLKSLSSRSGTVIAVNPQRAGEAAVAPLREVVQVVAGTIPGLMTQIDEEHPTSEPVMWSEALRIALDTRNGQHWLLVSPDIWVWPRRARASARAFLDTRRGKRFNDVHDRIVDAWVRVLAGTGERNVEVTLRTFNEGDEIENPSFRIRTRTAYTRKRTS